MTVVWTARAGWTKGSVVSTFFFYECTYSVICLIYLSICVTKRWNVREGRAKMIVMNISKTIVASMWSLTSTSLLLRSTAFRSTNSIKCTPFLPLPLLNVTSIKKTPCHIQPISIKLFTFHKKALSIDSWE